MKTSPRNTLLMSAVLLLFLFSFQFALADKDVKSQWVKHVISTGFKGAPFMNIADLNSDGRMDVLATVGRRYSKQYTDNDGAWWIKCPSNPKSGSWGTKYRITPKSHLVRWSLAIGSGDVDKDGDKDVLMLDHPNGKMFLSINPHKQGGNIYKTWQTKVLFDKYRRYGENVEVRDIDKDGWGDICFSLGDFNDMGVYVLWNPKGKPGNTWSWKKIGSSSGGDAHDAYIGDMDKDGDLDFVWAGGGGDTTGAVYWYEHPNGNPRGGSWKRHKVSDNSHNYGACKLDDINGDGYIDILVAEAHINPGNVWWYLNPKSKSASSWKRYKIGTQTYAHASTLIDVDGDGKNEYWLPDCSADKTGKKYEWANGGIVYL